MKNDINLFILIAFSFLLFFFSTFSILWPNFIFANGETFVKDYQIGQSNNSSSIDNTLQLNLENKVFPIETLNVDKGEKYLPQQLQRKF